VKYQMVGDWVEKLKMNKTYNGQIESLTEKQIFVFGSNTQGRHGKGSALIAKQKFGAIYGQAEGLQGQSYAIVTKDLTKKEHPSILVSSIKEQIILLYYYAEKQPDLEFFVAYNGNKINLNGYSNKEMASMFALTQIPTNIVFEEGFYQLILEYKEKIDKLTQMKKEKDNL
jgi:hypothetical protein